MSACLLSKRDEINILRFSVCSRTLFSKPLSRKTCFSIQHWAAGAVHWVDELVHRSAHIQNATCLFHWSFQGPSRHWKPFGPESQDKTVRERGPNYGNQKGQETLEKEWRQKWTSYQLRVSTYLTDGVTERMWIKNGLFSWTEHVTHSTKTLMTSNTQPCQRGLRFVRPLDASSVQVFRFYLVLGLH